MFKIVFRRVLTYACLVLPLAFQVSCLEKKQAVVFGAENKPKGSAEIQNHLTATSSHSMTVLLSSSDAVEVAFFIGEPCKPLNAKWASYVSEKTINLPESDGAHTIFVLFRNSNKFVSECISLPITIDRTGPTISQVQLQYKHSVLEQTPNFDIGNIVDASSDLKKIEGRVVQYSDQVAITGWIDFDKNTLAQKINSLALTDGNIYAVQLRALDSLDNIGPVFTSAPFQAGPSIVSGNQMYSSAGNVSYDLELSAPSLDDFEVAYFSQADTATEGRDFNAVNSKVIFPAGTDKATINLTLKEDLQSGPRRTFFLNSQPSQVGLVATPQAVTLTLPASPVLTSLPSMGLANLPETVDSAAALDVAVSSTNVTQYRYKLFREATDDCASYANYGSGVDIINSLTESLTQFPNGSNLTLCVTGKTDSQYLSFLESKWVKDNLVSVEFTDPGSVLTENTAQSFTVVVEEVKPYPIAVFYDVEGNATILDHNLTNGHVTIPAGQTSATVSYSTLRNTQTNASKTLRIRLTGTDSPAVTAVAAQENRIDDMDGGNLNDFLYKTVSAGGNSTCAITTTDKLKCWGKNDKGQLGDGSLIDKNRPVAVDSASNYSKASVGSYHSCGITTAGVLKCWGSNLNGRLGIGVVIGGDSNTPVVVDGAETYAEISVSWTASCGVTTQGVLKCWGARLGGLGSIYYSPTVYDNGVSYKSVSVAYYHACAITTSNNLKCWGDNTFFRLGDGGTTSRETPMVADSGNQYISISASPSTGTCGVTSLNKIRCWGDNSSMKLGVSSPTTITTPTTIDSANSYLKVSGNYLHGCGLTTAGKIRCWGSNYHGEIASQIRQGSDQGYLPKEVSFSSASTDLSIGGSHSCVIKSSGRLYCWGENTYGQLGRGITDSIDLAPATIVDSRAAYSSVDVGYFGGCGLTNTKPADLKCWGNGAWSPWSYSVPTNVDNADAYSYSQFSVSKGHICAITEKGVLKCWGQNTKNECGPDKASAAELKTPRVLDSENSYSQVSAGSEYSCGITTLGVLKCWGDNSMGQLGDGSGISQKTPVIISPGEKFSMVSTGAEGAEQTTCAITVAGVLKCWGSNKYYDIGDGTTTNRPSPVEVDKGWRYSKISVGGFHVCGITTSSGQLKCWGSTVFGALGDGQKMSTHKYPYEIDIGVQYLEISAGYKDTCGITFGGILKCWGEIFGTTSPTAIDEGTSYASVSVGEDFACGVTYEGTIKCWGDPIKSGRASVSMPWLPKPVMQASP